MASLVNNIKNNNWGTLRPSKKPKPLPTTPQSPSKALSISLSEDTEMVRSSSLKKVKPLPLTPSKLSISVTNDENNSAIANTPSAIVPSSPTTPASPLPSPKSNRPRKRKSSGAPQTSSPFSPKRIALKATLKGKLSVSPKQSKVCRNLESNLKVQVAKDAASKEIEDVLKLLSSYQKVIQDPDENPELQKITGHLQAVGQALAPFMENEIISNEEIEQYTPEHMLVLASKKLIAIKSNVEQTESEKKVDLLAKLVTSIKDYLETGTGVIEVPQIPLEMTITLINPLTATGNILTELFDTVYKSGFLKKQGRKMKLLSKRLCVVNHNQLLIYDKNQEQQKIIPLLDIKNITTMAGKDGYQYCVLSTDTRKYTFASKNKIELYKWTLIIDALQRPEFTSVITVDDAHEAECVSKQKILSFLYKEPFESGKITSVTYDEEWAYNAATGVLSNTKWGDTLEYIWDGSTLVPSTNSGMSLGHGKWNGVWLGWYTETKDIFMKYYYSSSARKYMVNTGNEDLTWQWALNQLVGKGGEWICDGNVPHPIVMFLQMMRFYRRSH